MAKTTTTASAAGYDLSSSPSHLLHRAQQFAADRFAAAVGDDPITQRQFAVLVGVAAHEGLTQTDLVNATGIDRSTLAELVARMSKNGHLKRTRAKSDMRANTVSLTAKGRALYQKTLPKVRKADDAILAILAKTKQPAFVSTLKEIAETLDKSEPAAPVKAKAATRSRATATKRRAAASVPRSKTARPARRRA
jgi:DNA-binding MarR family transcriptional regulator